MTRLMHVATLLACLAGVSFSASVSAQIYKWTDDQGRVHYGDMPPQSADSQSMNISQGNRAPVSSGSSTSRLESQQQYLQQLDETRAEKAAREAEAEEARQKEETMASMCNQLKAKATEAAAGGRRMYRYNEAGEREFLNDEQIDIERQRIQDEYRKRCG